MGLFDWLRGSAACPVPPEDRAWVDRRWAWLEGQFGRDFPARAEAVLASPECFPDPFSGTEACARRMLDRVCGYMEIDPGRIDMEMYLDRGRGPGSVLADGTWQGTGGLYTSRGGRFQVWVEVTTLADPLGLAATIAHELGHVLLLGHGRLTGDEEDHEPLTDLLTVFLGLGAVTANAVVHESNWREGNFSGWQIGRRGYLPMTTYGYALALFARSRDEDRPPWARELRPDVLAAFRQSQRCLAAEAAGGR